MATLGDRSGPLTYRTYDGRRKARFLDILSLFNRIINSKTRINELQELRRQQTRERVEFCQASAVHSGIGTLTPGTYSTCNNCGIDVSPSSTLPIATILGEHIRANMEVGCLNQCSTRLFGNEEF